jgi:hypothetical protein
MKKLIYIILCLILVSCYRDESQTLLSEGTSHRNSELSLIIKSISVHHASFDDVIDNSSCFSIEFPYQLNINSELKNISSLEDISEIHPEDQIEIVYPIQTTFYNYEEHQAFNQTEFNLISNTCHEDFSTQSNPCLDFQFPIILREFNDLTESFETFQLNSDRDVFIHFENFHDNDIYEIEYPIFLADSNSNTIRIDTNDDFIEAFNMSLNSCQ